MIQIVRSIKSWFEKALPTPTDQNCAVQIGVHIEEGAEMFEALMMPKTAQQWHNLADFFKKNPEAHTELGMVDRKLLLDSLCDQVVTAIGIGHMFGFNIVDALSEVNRSNWSKFVNGTPVFNEHGKIAKGPRYTPPDLAPFVGP